MNAPRSFAALILLLSLAISAAAQDTAAQLRDLDASLRESRQALEYYQDMVNNLGDTIFVMAVGKGNNDVYVPVPKKQFVGWASGEILTGSLSTGDITAIVNTSTRYKQVLKLALPNAIDKTQQRIEYLERQQKQLAQQLNQERSPGQELSGTWVGTSDKGGFREEWTIKGIDGRFDVGIAYYRGNQKVGSAIGNGSFTDGKLRFRATVTQKPDPAWASSVDLVASASGDTLTFQWSNEGGSGTVSLTRKTTD